MTILSIMDPQARLRCQAGALYVEQDRVLQSIPLHQIHAVQLLDSATLSGMARKILLQQGIPVTFLDHSGRCVGRLVAPLSRSGERRLMQARFYLEGSQRLAIAQQIVHTKIVNQRAVLAARQARLQHEGIWEPLSMLQSAALRAKDTPSLDTLRGVEGMAARHYFAGFGFALSHPDFSFSRRTRRPPRDPVNAALSFGYALLQARCEGALEVVGLDPYIGVLHETSRGQPALALDLMEPLRPLIDRMILSLFNRRQFSPKSFRNPLPEELGPAVEPPGLPPPVYLAPLGRAALLREWDRLLRKDRLHDPNGDGKWPLIDLLPQLAMSFARVFEDNLSSIPLLNLSEKHE